MAHHIESNDHLFYTGTTPWHGMGTKLPSLATAQEAIEAARLDWTVKKEPVVTEAGKVLAGSFITVREDTQDPLGVVGSQYQVLQNEQAFNFFDAITQDPHGPKYEVAGSLWNGRKTWMLARMPELLQVVPGDDLGQFILLSNTHDGSSSVRVMMTSVRVVCQNTLTLAHSGSGRGTRIRHSGDILTKVKSVQDALGIIRHSFSETLEVYQALAKKEPTKEEVETVLTALFPDTKSDRAKLQRERVLSLAEAGMGNANAKVRGTAWALYNGVTELVDHVNNEGSKREDKADMRLNSIWLGSGMDLKEKALSTIREVCLK